MKQLFCFCGRRWFFLVTLFVVLFAQTSPPFKADSFFGVARPYFFSIARWEAQNLWKKWQYELIDGRAVARASSSDQIQTVQEYFRLAAKANEIQQRLNQYQIQGNPPVNPEVASLKLDLVQTNEQRASMKNRIEAIIENQISEAIREESINLQWNFPRIEFFFPPVDFELTPLPNVLIISPRDKIEIKDSVLLKPPLSPEGMNDLEAKQEKLGYSAVVDNIGGVATYPAMVADSGSLEFTINAAAHEWVHHYLFLRPLGRHYGTDYTMLTLNESTADIVGGEIADKVLKTYGIIREKQQRKRQVTTEKGFNFNREMRQIRLTVDDYLANGEIENAEKFMEERRQFLVSQGYYIRKLNQAYFAFHGSYSESPASSSPIAMELRTLRQTYGSLGEFARAVSGVANYAEFKALQQNNRERSSQ